MGMGDEQQPDGEGMTTREVAMFDHIYLLEISLKKS
jgi:hypothetical protein